MHLSESALREFKELYRQVVGEDLPDAELLECAHGIIKLVQLIIEYYEKRNPGK